MKGFCNNGFNIRDGLTRERRREDIGNESFPGRRL